MSEKDMGPLRAFEDALLDGALRQGCGAAEIYCAESDAFSADVLNGQTQRFSVSRTRGVGLRVQANGHDGYAYTEQLGDENALVRHALDNARTVETDDVHPMQTAQTYREVKRTPSPMDALSAEEKIALACEMERLTLAADGRVKRVTHCAVQTSAGRVHIRNTQGLSASRETGTAFCYVSPLVEQDGEVQTGFAFRVGANACDVAACAKEAVRDALDKLGGKPVPSGGYRVLLTGYAMANLLDAFSGVFSAEQAQKGCSLLNGREGERIAADCVTLIDDPFDPISPRAFDGEGTPCYVKAIVERGIFKTLLHNLSTARKAGVETTGNAVRASAASSVSVGAAVLRLAAGADGFETMRARLSDGLVITDLEGLHAGLNSVSGDFSLKAAGRRIRNGRDAGAVGGITLAGNFFTLLKDVEAVGSDTLFPMPSSCWCGCPSVLVRQLTVAGT